MGTWGDGDMGTWGIRSVFPIALLPLASCLLPIPYSRFPIPCSLGAALYFKTSLYSHLF